MSTTDDYSPRMRIFFPQALESVKRVRANGEKFIYYTTAATAVRLIQSNSIWMRSSLVMNDSAEVKHGLQLLTNSLASAPGKAIQQAVDSIFPGLYARQLENFQAYAPVLQYDTFVTSVSEYDEANDPDGQLSMWRAYGGNAGVAFVLNGGPLLRPSHALAVYASPVAYFEQTRFDSAMMQLANSIANNADEVRSLGHEEVQAALYNAFRFAATCTKNPAFKEEREWRLIASEVMHPMVKIKSSVEIIGDTPQVVIKIPLVDIPGEGLTGLSLENLVDQILIGPTEFPMVIHRAIARQLVLSEKDGIGARIRQTNIPLRPNQR